MTTTGYGNEAEPLFKRVTVKQSAYSWPNGLTACVGDGCGDAAAGIAATSVSSTALTLAGDGINCCISMCDVPGAGPAAARGSPPIFADSSRGDARALAGFVGATSATGEIDSGRTNTS